MTLSNGRFPRGVALGIPKERRPGPTLLGLPTESDMGGTWTLFNQEDVPEEALITTEPCEQPAAVGQTVGNGISAMSTTQTALLRHRRAREHRAVRRSKALRSHLRERQSYANHPLRAT